ncbi:hypothetical protein D3C81_1078660 [compost metagenome]
MAVKKPFPKGAKGTNPIPNSSNKGNNSFSGSLQSIEYSLSTTVKGQIACAFLIVSIPASESPQCLILPSSINSFIVCATTSIGVLGSTLCK